MKNPEVNPVLFPCLIITGDALLRVTKRDFIKFVLKQYCGENRYLFKNNLSLQFNVSNLIDREGCLRPVRKIGERRMFFKPLAKLYDLTLMEVQIDAGRQVTAGELLQKIDHTKSPPGFPVAGHLKGFLRKQAASALFDSGMFRQFWAEFGPELAVNEWEEFLPDM